MTIDRRAFLKLSSAIGGGLLFNVALQPTAVSADVSSSFQANVYLRFNVNGTVSYRDTKPEMGQAVSTGLAMVVCDELGADWSKFIVDRPPLTSKMEISH
ncbi:MAG: twin-arginine translocation signal domain-containing protein, partial [Kordiimonas sp.]